MSANPDVVGGILVVIVIGVFVLYAWLDSKTKPHYSRSYSSRKPEPVYSEPQEHSAYDIGYEQELGRQRAIEEARRQSQQGRIREQNRRDAEEYYNNTLITGVEAPRGYDPLRPKKRKKNQSFYDY